MNTQQRHDPGRGGRARISTVEHLLSALLRPRGGQRGDRPRRRGSAGRRRQRPRLGGTHLERRVSKFWRRTRPARRLPRGGVGGGGRDVGGGDACDGAEPGRGHRLRRRGGGAAELWLPVTPARYAVELAPARTFCFQHEVEALLAAGLAKGGTEENALVVAPEGYSRPPRFPDEAVRHKAMDAVGDLALCGGAAAGAGDPDAAQPPPERARWRGPCGPSLTSRVRHGHSVVRARRAPA